MKKQIPILLFLIVMSSMLVSAIDLAYGARQWADLLQGIFEPILILIVGSSEFLIEKTLLFLIVLVFVYAIIKEIPTIKNNKAGVWITTIAVSVLSIRFVSDISWIKTIMTPYGVLGIALTSFIPFMLFFYFVEMNLEPGLLRRVAWALYAAVFIGLWFSRYEEIGNPAWIYFATAIISITVLIWDGYIRGYFLREAIAAGLTPEITKQIIDVRADIADLSRRLGRATGEEYRILSNEIANKKLLLRDLSLLKRG